jgi:hypothetical protein
MCQIILGTQNTVHPKGYSEYFGNYIRSLHFLFFIMGVHVSID